MAVNVILELEIRDLLLKKASAHDVLERLMARFYDTQFSLDDRRQALAFAWNTGLFQQALEHFPDFLNRRLVIPWGWFAEFMAKAKVPMGSEWREALLKGARRQEQMEDLSICKSWDSSVPEISTWRAEAQKRRQEGANRQRQTLFEKLAFFRNEQMAEEERRLLDLLKKMYPGDPEVARFESEFDERWARHVIAKHSADHDPLQGQTDATWSDSVLRATEPMVAEMERLVQRRPEMAYDFAVALVTMDLENQADALIPRPVTDSGCDWLIAEILLRSRRFVDCLDHLTGLELRFSGDPETAFAITYLRAQAFWGLGQTHRAVELLETLISIRPHYRSAASLLKQWLAGGPPA